MSMKRKVTIGMIALLTNMILYTGCSNSNVSLSNSSPTLPEVNETSIAAAIEQSAMEDGGYRFANAEFESQFSVYATYYIRMAKEYAGWSQSPISPETKSEIEEKFLNASDMDLTDIFCAISLLGSNENLLAKTKENISSYLDSLYDKDLKCYTLFYNGEGNEYIFNIYANYLVDFISSSLNIEMKPIDDWLEKAIEEVFVSDEIIADNSSAYSMFFELAKNHNIEVPETSITAIIQMFENTLDNMDELDNQNIYVPVFLMDYLDFSRFAGYDSSKNYDKVIRVLCDENGVKKDAFVEYDAYGLYATIRALKLANYNFESCVHFREVFNEFDSFLLSEDSYMSPGYVESNFVDTYYVDALIHDLGIDSSNTISQYCIENKPAILESDVLNIYYFLELLQRNDLLELVDAERDEIIQKLSSSIQVLASDPSSINANLPKINGCIKGLKILNENPQFSEEYYDAIVKNFSVSSDQQQKAYDLAGLIEFICLVSPDNIDDSKEYCHQLETTLIQLSSEDVSNKIMLQKMALNVFELSNYVVTSEFNQIVVNTLSQSQDESGLFKGGDSNDDLVSFRSTYDAVVLCESIN